MRRAILAALLIGGASLLSACGSSEPDTGNLTGRTWYLIAGSEKSPAWQWAVPADQQANFTIAFNTDATFVSTAACNQLAGAWEASGKDGLTITPGPMTMAFCGPRSLDVLYAGLLGQAASYAVAGTGLVITLDDGGTLEYTSLAPTVTPVPATPTPSVAPTPTASPKPTPKPTASPTPKPTATPKASATPRPSGTPKPTARPTATPAPTPRPTPTPTPRPTATPSPTPTPGTGLLGTNWQLNSIALTNPPFQGVVPEADRSKYTIQFAPDGTFSAQADCNRVAGTYSTANPNASSGNLTITPGTGTLVMCAEGSYSDLYIVGLGSVTSYTISGGSLVLTLGEDGSLQYR